MARVLLGVRGLETRDQAERVKAVIAAAGGVQAVALNADGQLEVEYDDSEVTVMDLIRALRRIGFLAGVE